MSVSYKKLWKLLIDKDMKKKDLCERAGISPASVTKMGRNGHVTTEILVKICTALDCRIEDMVEASNPVPTPLLGHRCRSSQEITGSPTPFSTSNHYLWIWLSASFSLSNPNIAA